MSTPEKWDRFSIKAAVHRKGLTLTGIAKAAGLHDSACRQGLFGVSKAGAVAIAKALDVPFRELFPDSYIRGRHNEPKTKRKPVPAASQNAHTDADDVRRAS